MEAAVCQQQACAQQLAVEGLDERVVCGFARAGEVEDHTALVCPQIHVPRYKFAAIVHPDRLRIWAVEHRSSPQRMNALPNLSGSPSSALDRKSTRLNSSH